MQFQSLFQYFVSLCAFMYTRCLNPWTESALLGAVYASDPWTREARPWRWAPCEVGGWKKLSKLGNSLKHCPSLSVASWLLTVQICTNTKDIASSKSQMLINGGKCRAVQGWEKSRDRDCSRSQQLWQLWQLWYRFVWLVASFQEPKVVFASESLTSALFYGMFATVLPWWLHAPAE